MHAIIQKDQDIKSAIVDLAEAQDSRRRYTEKVAQARAEFKREQQAALDRGETHCPPLQVVEDNAVSSHLQTLETRAAAEFSDRAGRAAGRLVPLLEAREAELLGSVSRAKVADLGRIGDEIGQLAAAKTWLRGLATWQPYRGMPPTEPDEAVAYPPEKLVEAARTGGTLIGRTLPPETAAELDAPFAAGGFRSNDPQMVSTSTSISRTTC